jgi:hypothetical protein
MAKADRERVRRVAEPFVRRPSSTAARRAGLTIPPQAAASAALQRRANRVLDALDLLNRAERAGLPPVRARRLHCMLTEPTAPAATIERIERSLRSWTDVRQSTRLPL